MFDSTKFHSEEAFCDFLKSKGDEFFDYFDHDNCVYSQWARACGGKSVCASGYHVIVENIPYPVPAFEKYRPFAHVLSAKNFLHNIQNKIPPG